MCVSWTATGFVPSSRCILSPRFISSWRCWILVISHGRRCLSCRSLKRVHSKVWDLSSDFQFNLYALSTFQFNCITSTNTCWTRKWWKRKFALPINVQTCLPKHCLVMLSDICVGNTKLPQLPCVRGGMSRQEQQERILAHRLETFNVNLAHSFAKHLSWTYYSWWNL